MRSGAANAQAAWFAAATSLSMVPNAANGNTAVSGGGRTEQARNRETEESEPAYG